MSEKILFKEERHVVNNRRNMELYFGGVKAGRWRWIDKW